MKQVMRAVIVRHKFILLVISAAVLPHSLFAQSGTLGSTSSPVVNAFGRPMAGVDVSICQPLGTTAAQVVSNTAVLTMASNPIAAGFAPGMTIQVSGFSGADTYFNGGTFANGTGITAGFVILSVTPSTITYALTHANATASSNGTVLQQGNATTGCAGLSPVYADPGMTQPITQPIVTDAYGNWNAFAQSGQLYYVQFYGSGVTTSMRWIMVNVTANAAVKPQANDAVLYVSPNGNDSNDGLSNGTAKQTIMAGYDALPSGGGTIYVSGSGAACTATAGQGMWIMGSSDPNYASPPTGWHRAKNGPVAILGVSATHTPFASKVGWATQVNCGNNSNPGIWLSGVTAMQISHLAIQSQKILISFDSNGSGTDANGQSNNIFMDHNDFRSDCSTCGPVVDIAGGIWDEFDFNLFENNGINDGISASSNLASNVFMSNGGSTMPIGLLYFNGNDLTGGGGYRFDALTNQTGSVYIAKSEMEGATQCQPLFEVINSGSPFSATIDIQGGFSDCGSSPPLVRVAAGNDPCNTSVRGINQNGQVPALEGPLTIGDTACPAGTPSGGISQADGGVPFAGVIPAAKNQRGGFYGLQNPQVDEVRRAFIPSFVRFANLAAQNPTSWTSDDGNNIGGSLTQFQGPGDASGVTNAAKLNCTGNGTQGGCDYYVFDINLTFGPSDYIYWSAWVQPASTAGFNQSATGVFGSGPVSLEFVNNAPVLRAIAGGPGAPFLTGRGWLRLHFGRRMGIGNTSGAWQKLSSPSARRPQ